MSSSFYSDGSTLQWENGRSERITRGDDRSGGFWSSGGRSGPQPETGGECLAILNNVYNDGIKWHDIECRHKKPIICQVTVSLFARWSRSMSGHSF